VVYLSISCASMKRDFWYRSVGNFFIKIVWIYIRFILTNISCQVFSSVLFILFLNVCASITILDSFYVSQDNELTKFSPTSLSSSIFLISFSFISACLAPSARICTTFYPMDPLILASLGFTLRTKKRLRCLIRRCAPFSRSRFLSCASRFSVL
jgi:hypothetical protein